MIPAGWLEWTGEREGEFLMQDGRKLRHLPEENPVAWRPLDEPANETVDLSRLKAGIR